MLLALLAACPSTTVPKDTASTACGTVTLGSDYCETLPTEVQVWTIADGMTGCTDAYDTGGGGADWRGELIATLSVDDAGVFEAVLDPGTYAFDADTGECCACEIVEITDKTCDPIDLVMEETISVDAPNVYLYPETTTAVLVRLGSPQALTIVDPLYPVDGWKVLAEPDGTLHTTAGLRDFLYYERSFDPKRFQTDAGWCASGFGAQASIEDALADLGFSTPEIDDFHEYWDENFPRVGDVTIYPQLRRLPTLDVSPMPDSVLRAWFYVEEGCAAVPMPELPAFAGHGFVVTEWGVALGSGLK